MMPPPDTRSSCDNILNSFGRSLIEICASLNLIILKGYCSGDMNGSYTFTSPNGRSVIYNCVVSDEF